MHLISSLCIIDQKFNVQANMGGLISNSHAWILPSYYNPNWWKIEDERPLKDDECSNEEMRNILESVIFIDTVKFPPTVRLPYPRLVISADYLLHALFYTECAIEHFSQPVGVQGY